MKKRTYSLLIFLGFAMVPGIAQEIGKEQDEGDGWDRTQKILDCAPKLVDRRDMVEDNFNHRYVTSNPRDIEVGYFSVEPVTYLQEGRRFCEALLPAAGVSDNHFRGTYTTTYHLPGNGTYSVRFISQALIFNNEIRMIDAQNTIGAIEAFHRLEVDMDTSMNLESAVLTQGNNAYRWDLEIDQQGSWQGHLHPGDFDLHDPEIPSGFSTLMLMGKIRGPGVVTIQETVVFEVSTLSAYKYAPIFQAPCLFSLEPLGISARLLPCE